MKLVSSISKKILTVDEIVEKINNVEGRLKYLFVQEQALKKVFQLPKEFKYVEIPKKLLNDLMFNFENYEPLELINYLSKFGYKL